MEEAVDGEYQNFKAKGGGYTREHFFGKYPELKQMVANMSDDDVWRLNRGGHDPHKVYAAYAQAVAHRGQPTVILAKTVKGYGWATPAKGRTSPTSRRRWRRTRSGVSRPLPDPPHRRPDRGCPVLPPPTGQPRDPVPEGTPPGLGGFLPARADRAAPLQAPGIDLCREPARGEPRRGRSRPRCPSCGC